jgi:hypothetical protein
MFLSQKTFALKFMSMFLEISSKKYLIFLSANSIVKRIFDQCLEVASQYGSK